jgi:hypothetical protein
MPQEESPQADDEVGSPAPRHHEMGAMIEDGSDEDSEGAEEDDNDNDNEPDEDSNGNEATDPQLPPPLVELLETLQNDTPGLTYGPFRVNVQAIGQDREWLRDKAAELPPIFRALKRTIESLLESIRKLKIKNNKLRRERKAAEDELERLQDRRHRRETGPEPVVLYSNEVPSLLGHADQYHSHGSNNCKSICSM